MRRRLHQATIIDWLADLQVALAGLRAGAWQSVKLDAGLRAVETKTQPLRARIRDHSLMIPALGRETLARLRGSPRLFLFDVDGTLAPIGPRANEARIPETTRAALASLAAQPATHVGLVTGRGALDARRMMPDVPAWIIGNHGIEVLEPDGTLRVNPAALPYRALVEGAVHDLARVCARVPGTFVEDKTWTLSFHYRLAGEEMEEPLRAEAFRVAEQNGLRMMQGKKIYELRPPVTIDKGTAVLELANALGGLAAGSAVLFAGDDLTDEDAFIALARAAPHAVTVRISDADPATLRTAATLVARDPAAFGEFLEWLASAPAAGASR